jgi:hypothetical protein
MLDVVAQLPDLELIEYYGYGEPFIHRDSISFLREVRRTRPDVEIVTATNGTVMTPAQIEAIAAEALLDRVVFSIDGATPESYRKYRVGGSFDKAFAKMKSLVEACQAAKTWRKCVLGPKGKVQITWQYILFEWNDSEEEVLLARQLAHDIDVPIEWTVTSGYGASKRFVSGSAAAARLMDPPDSYIHLASNADIDIRLADRGIGSIIHYSEVHLRCEVLSLPVVGRGGTDYNVSFYAEDSFITASAGATILFNINIYNRTGRTWDVTGLNALRLGILEKTVTGATIRELPGAKLPQGAARLGGHDNVLVPVTLPDRPGEFQLMIDLVQEWVCWFFERGSQPWTCLVQLA